MSFNKIRFDEMENQTETMKAHKAGSDTGLTTAQTNKILDLFNTAKATSVAAITAKTKIDAKKVTAVLSTQSLFQVLRGVNTKRDGPSRRWLHRPAMTTFSADLIDITATLRRWKPRHARVYALTVIDHGTRMLRVVPIWDKSQETTIEAFDAVMRSWPRAVPESRKTLTTDAGGEFGRKFRQHLLETHNIVTYES